MLKRETTQYKKISDFYKTMMPYLYARKKNIPVFINQDDIGGISPHCEDMAQDTLTQVEQYFYELRGYNE